MYCIKLDKKDQMEPGNISYISGTYKLSLLLLVYYDPWVIAYQALDY